MNASSSSIDLPESKYSLHVLISIPSLTNGGAERQVSAISSELVTRGLRVSIVTYLPPGDSDYETESSVQRFWLDAQGIQHRSRVLRAFKRFVGLRRLLCRLSPDITVAFLPSSTIVTTLASMGLPHARVGSIRIHPPASSRRVPLTETLMHRFTFPRMDSIVALTGETEEWIRQHYPRATVTVIPNMVGTKGTNVAESRFSERDSCLILAVGRLTPQKGFDVLLRAVADTFTRHPSAHLTILGDGPERGRLLSLREELDLTGRVDFRGRVTDIESWYEKSDVFVLSSRYEGFPNVLIEAMSMGIAVISTDCPTGPRDIITDGSDGLLVRVDDSTDMAAALDELLSNSELRRHLGTSARRVGHRYGSNEIGQRWMELLHEVAIRRREGIGRCRFLTVRRVSVGTRRIRSDASRAGD